MDAGHVSTYASVNKAFENIVRWLCVLASVFPLSTLNKVGGRTALFWYRSCPRTCKRRGRFREVTVQRFQEVMLFMQGPHTMAMSLGNGVVAVETKKARSDCRDCAVEVLLPVAYCLCHGTVVVSLRDGAFSLSWTSTVLCYFGPTSIILYAVVRATRFREYADTVAPKFASVLGPFGDRGDTPRVGLMGGTAPCCMPIHPDAVPCSLYSHSQRSCRPQPRRIDGDVTPRKDTRQDRRLFFKLPLHHVLLQGGPKCVFSMRLAPGTRTQVVESAHEVGCSHNPLSEPKVR